LKGKGKKLRAIACQSDHFLLDTAEEDRTSFLGEDGNTFRWEREEAKLVVDARHYSER
jgi:hypothetical protein